MKLKRRTFLAGLAAATAAATWPKTAPAALSSTSVATLIDLSLCDGCTDRGGPKCVAACREKNRRRFPEPNPNMLKDYWPKDYHEDWSKKRDVNWRLTPYNWLFVEELYLDVDGKEQQLFIPRRCMHCDNPPCVKLCPFGTAKKDPDGPVHIDPDLCFGGAKCRAVCPWHVPQRQTGVGIYTKIDPLPIGAGVMYKCDLCRDLLSQNKTPACMAACPRNAMRIGPREEIQRLAQKRSLELGGEIYGRQEHGGTATLYVSKIAFETIDRALTEGVPGGRGVMRFHQPDNEVSRHSSLAQTALLAPLAGAVGAFAATIKKKENHRDD